MLLDMINIVSYIGYLITLKVLLCSSSRNLSSYIHVISYKYFSVYFPAREAARHTLPCDVSTVRTTSPSAISETLRMQYR